MNATIVLAFLLMLVIVAAMAVGVAFGRKPIAGSCGGMKALGLDVECEICGGNPSMCETGQPGKTDSATRARAALLGVDATPRD